jgi:uncharacterized repeat protein (TIGR01451 family)
MRRRRKSGQTPILILVTSLVLAIGAGIPSTALAQGGTQSADLSLTKVDNPDPVITGAALTYAIEVRNEGPDAATEVALTDDLPGGVELVSVVASQGVCEPKPSKVTCTLASLPTNGVWTVTIVVTVTKKKGTITNSASVQSAVPDPQPANNLVTQATQIVQPTGGPTCKGKQATIVGTEADETLHGTEKRDVILALGGHDVIFGFGRNDVVCGGTGNDTIRGQSGQDLLRGGAGNDIVKGARDNDDVGGGAGRDRLGGGLGIDILKGGPGRDTCRGGPGPDLERSC